MDSRREVGNDFGGNSCGLGGFGGFGGFGNFGGCFNMCGEFQSPRFRMGVSNVPMQQFHRLYCPEEALRKGTIFSELYMPFHGCKGG